MSLNSLPADFHLGEPEIEQAFMAWCDANPFGEVTLSEAWIIFESFEAGYLAAKELYAKKS